MSVVKQEYNFNYPNMNFGQAILTGMFGSLTGGYGMGGCFGGFNTGCGPSIFPMGTMMTGYNCFAGMGGYSDQMVGAQIGLGVTQTLIGGLTQYIEGRGGEKAEREKAVDTASNNIETLTAEISELERENNGLMQNGIAIQLKYGDDVPSAIASACSTEASKYTQSCKDLKDIGDKFEESPYYNSLDETDKNSNPKSEKYNAALENYNTKHTALVKAQNENLVALNKAIKDKIESNTKEITREKADLEKAKNTLAETYTGRCEDQTRYNEITGGYSNNSFGRTCTSKNIDNFAEAFMKKIRDLKAETDDDKKDSLKQELKNLYNHIKTGLGGEADIPSKVRAHYSKIDKY